MEKNSTFNDWDWENRYKIGTTVWQYLSTHPKLVQHLNSLTNGVSNLKIFVPLCGKTKDIPYLLSLGHTVFGIEFVLQAIQELQIENDIKMELDPVTSVYSTSDGKLKIFHGDFFKCPIENFGPFDAIWDRGSFGSFDFSLREDYLQVIKRSVYDSNGSECFTSQYTLHNTSTIQIVPPPLTYIIQGYFRKVPRMTISD